MYFKEIENSDLKNFIKYSEHLTSLYHIKRDDYDENWIDVKTTIANSILSLYKFSDSLFKSEKFNSSHIRFYTFYFDLILSKLRHSLFTETPKKSYIDIHTYTAKDIAFIGEEILGYEFINDNFEIDFQRFIFKIFLMYDFIFYGDSGVFTRFELNSSLYNTIEKDVLTFDSKDSLRQYGKDIITNILDTTMKYYDIENSDDIGVYESFVSKSKKSIVLIEPLSYYLGFKIWKFAKIIQSTYEFQNLKDMQNEKDRFKKVFEIYLNKSKNIISQFYNKEITNRELFLQLGSIDKEIISKHLFNSILPTYTSKEFVLDDMVKIDLVPNTLKKTDIENTIKQMIDNDQYDRFKFYRVLEDCSVSIEKFSYLISLLSKFLPKDDNYEIVGMLRSGVLLAHCLNVSNYQNKPIYMFSSFSYISLLPRTNISKNSNILFIDESIKSAFSTVLANIYKQRNLWTNKNSIYNYSSSVATIVNFEDFKKENIDISFKSILNLKAINGDIVLENNDQEYKIESIFDWKSYFLDLEEPKIDFDDITIEINGIKRIDIARILIDSHKLFKIAKVFATKIKNTIEDDELILYASTDEGKLLVDATILAYKSLFSENPKTFILNKKIANQKFNDESTKLLFVDMTIDTMHTIERTLEFDFDTTLDKVELSLTILASKKAQDTLSTKLCKIDDLHVDEK